MTPETRKLRRRIAVLADGQPIGVDPGELLWLLDAADERDALLTARAAVLAKSAKIGTVWYRRPEVTPDECDEAMEGLRVAVEACGEGK